MAHNMHLFIVKPSNSLLRRMLVIVIVENGLEICLKNECTLTILCIANGARVEEFHLIILRLKWLGIVTVSYHSD